MINNEELLFVVDESNRPLRSESRKDVHKNGYWHRVSHIWIINSKKQILCQKRTLLKDINPGKWEAHFGGHVRENEEYIDNAVKETQEELGLERKKEDMIFFKICKYAIDKEFQGVFYTKWDGDINSLIPEPDEVEEIAWLDFGNVQEKLMEADPSWITHGYEHEILDLVR